MDLSRFIKEQLVVSTIIPVHWSDNTGPFIYVHSSDVYAETYTTKITWTLVDAP